MSSTTESPSRMSGNSRPRLIVGGSLWLITRFTPLLIPAVQTASLSDGIKLALSGLLVFGIPELFLLIAVAIMGRDGYRFVTELIFRMIRKHAPPEHVSRLRYRIGLVLFCIPVVFAIVSPYLAHLVPPLETNGRVLAVVGDVLLLVSLFVLGGGFWDKLRALFVYEATTSFTQQVPDSD